MRISICTSFLVALVFLVGSPRAFAQDAASAASAASAAAPAPAPAPAPVATTAPVAAPAQAAEPARVSEPGWSLGAGVLFFSGVTSGIIASPNDVSVPFGAVASLERRLGSSTWLVLGVNASYLRNRGDAPPEGSFGYTHRDFASVGASAGIRQQVTGARAPVAVSILALAEGGWVDQDDRYVDYTGVNHITGSGWAAGASLGLAIERDLTTRLALRLATPLLFASYMETRSETNGTGEAAASSVRAGVVLAPSLQLRLYF